MTARLTVGADTAHWPSVVRFIESFATSRSLPPDDRSRLLILVEELFTNLVKYGYEPGTPRGTAEIGLAFEGGRLTITFDDDGRAFDPLRHDADHIDKSMEERPVGGIGLHLIRSMSDEAGYARRDNRNCLRLVRMVR